MSEFKRDRRTFIKTGAALAASLAPPWSVAQPKESAARATETMAASDFKPMSKVNCFSEDGELKEVGFGAIDGFVLPDYDPIYDFAGKTITDLLKKAGGKTFEEAAREWLKQVKE